MKLLDYLRRNEITYRELGERVGASAAQIHRIAHGKKGASLSLAVKISEATRGAVQPADLIPEPEPAQ